jgi:hypothetical protein
VQARAKIPRFAQYEDDWVTADFVKMYMKNKRAYRKRREAMDKELEAAFEDMDVDGGPEEDPTQEYVPGTFPDMSLSGGWGPQVTQPVESQTQYEDENMVRASLLLHYLS